MTITLELPDSLRRDWQTPPATDPLQQVAVREEDIDAHIRRALLESFAAEMYRTRQWGTRQVREVLGFADRWDAIDFLSERGLYPNYDTQDLVQDLKTLSTLPYPPPVATTLPTGIVAPAPAE